MSFLRFLSFVVEGNHFPLVALVTGFFLALVAAPPRHRRSAPSCCLPGCRSHGLCRHVPSSIQMGGEKKAEVCGGCGAHEALWQ